MLKLFEIDTGMELPVVSKPRVAKIKSFEVVSSFKTKPTHSNKAVAQKPYVDKEKIKQDKLKRFLCSLHSAIEGKRLFCLRYDNETKVQGLNQEVVYFSSKEIARTIRDKLQNEFDVKTFISKGVDHGL